MKASTGLILLAGWGVWQYANAAPEGAAIDCDTGRPIYYQLLNGFAAVGDILIAAEADLAGPCIRPPRPVARKSGELPGHGPEGTHATSAVPWPGGKVPFRIHANVDPQWRTALTKAISHVQSYTGVEFFEYNPADGVPANYVEVKYYPPSPESNADAAADWLGVKGGRQELQLMQHPSMGLLVHEMLHILGFGHEHTRPDRDDHVIMDAGCLASISPAARYQYDTSGMSSIGQYDLASIMHYAFGVSYPVTAAGSYCDPMTGVRPADLPLRISNPRCEKPNADNIIEAEYQVGQRCSLSSGDVGMVNAIYPYPVPPPLLTPKDTAEILPTMLRAQRRVPVSGLARIIGNPYGDVAVQGASLSGDAVFGFSPNVVIQLGPNSGGAGVAFEMEFQSLDLASNESVTFRAGAAGQVVSIKVAGSQGASIAGNLRAQENAQLPAPNIRVATVGGIRVHPGGQVLAREGLTVDTFPNLNVVGAGVGPGGPILNQGTIDGGKSLMLFGGGINGGGTFRGDRMTLGLTGNANNPVNGSHYLANSLQLFPGSGDAVRLDINHFGTGPQVINLHVHGHAVASMPSVWPSTLALLPNNAPVPKSGVRLPGVPEPSYGGGSMIVQSSGDLRLVPGGSSDFAFPGGIVLKADGVLDLGGVLVDQGWTTAGRQFQGLFFEAPTILGAYKIELLSNNLNWVNFSVLPRAPVSAWVLATQPDGSAAFVVADATAPHVNVYSLITEAAANGACWICLVNSQVVNMTGN